MCLRHLPYHIEAYLTVCDYAAFMLSTSHAIARVPWRGLTPLCHIDQACRSFPTCSRFVFAPVNLHEIKKGGYSDVSQY